MQTNYSAIVQKIVKTFCQKLWEKYRNLWNIPHRLRKC